MTDAVTMETSESCQPEMESEAALSIPEQIFNCAISGDVEQLKLSLQQGEEQHESDYFSKKDAVGRDALLTAAMLGHCDIIKKLVKQGAPVNRKTERGYTSLHLAACWGHVDTLNTLLERDADTLATTFNGDKAVDLAKKYSRTDCVECLLVAEAKQRLTTFVTFVKDAIYEAERKLTKDEKNKCMRACTAKSEWINSAKHPSALDYYHQKTELEDLVQPYLTKLFGDAKYAARF